MRKFNSYVIIILSILVSNISCAQKFEKPPMSNKNKLIDKKPLKLTNVINNLSQLSVDSKGLNCYKIDNECHILDGITTIYSQYQTTGDDNPSLVPYIYAEGEFLEGKYNGVWRFYDKNSNLIKIEKWDNGALISTKNY
jgi:antitoxin component YwqK of YwqJK toxin-antitoxin module